MPEPVNIAAMSTDDRWLLSAATTAVLLHPTSSSRTVLKLAVKELVVVGAWTLRRSARPRRWSGPEEVVTLLPGTRPVPNRPPLVHLSSTLSAAAPHGGLLRDVVRAAVSSRKSLADECRQEARDELVRRNLVRAEQRWYGTRIVRTPAGDLWAQACAARHAQWREAMEVGGPAAAAAVVAATASPGLVLLLDHSTLLAIDD